MKKPILKKAEPYLWLLPAFILFAVFTFYPFLVTAFKSLFIVDSFGHLKRFVGLENYAYIFEDKVFVKSIINTLIFTLLTVPTSKILGLLLALLANKRRKTSAFYEASFAVPMAMASSVTAMIFQLLYVPSLGLINGVFGLDIQWLNDPKFALLSISIVQIWLSTGYAFIFLLSAVRGISPDIIESASLEGASPLQMIFKIYLPLTSPTMFYLIITDISFSVMMMSLSNVLTNGGPQNSTITMMQYIYKQIAGTANYTNANPAAIVAFLIAFAATMAGERSALSMKKKTLWDISVQAVCILCALLILFPILYACSVSFMEQKDVLSSPPNLLPPKVTLENYRTAFSRTMLLRYMLNSFIVASVCSVTRMVTATMAAFAFSFFEFKGKKILFALTMATIMIPPDVLIVSNFTTISRMGLINTYAGMCSIFLVSATNVFLLRQFYLSFVKSLKEAAYVDGCGNVRFFLWVLLPASKPIMVTVFLSSFVSVWNQYVWPMLVTNQNEMRTIQVGITMLKDRESAVFGPVMAGVIIALLPTVLLFVLFQRKIVSGMMSGAVKE